VSTDTATGRSVIELDPRHPVIVLPPEDEQPGPETETAA
jgi:hypothetical protein